MSEERKITKTIKNFFIMNQTVFEKIVGSQMEGIVTLPAIFKTFFEIHN